MPFILLPIFIPPVAGLTLLVIRRIKPDFGYFWIASLLTALAAWGGLLALRWQTPVFFSMNLWQEIGFQVEFPFFQLDQFSWPYAFALSGLLLAAILTAPVRISKGSNPSSWAADLILFGLFLMGILAANPLTLILAWSGMDMLELGYMLRHATDNSTSRRAVVSFFIGIAGTFLGIWAMLVSQTQGLPLSFNSMTPDASQFLALAAGVRLAVFPIMIAFRQEMPMRTGLGTLLKFAGPSASLVLLAHLPAGAVSGSLSPVLFSLTLAALLYGSVMWVRARDEISGRPYWILSFSALSLSCLLQGRPDVSPVWGSAMILGGGLLSLYTTREVRLLFIPLIAFLCLTGIIFTPVSAGWVGVWMEPFQFSNVLYVVGVSLVLAGFLKHTFRQNEFQEEIDRWVLVIYPAGLVIILATFVLTGIWSVEQYGIQFIWPGPTAATGLALFWLGLRRWLESEKPFQSLIKSIARMAGEVVNFVVSLKWLYWIGGIVFSSLRLFIFWLTNILEGDGGVLWAILALLFFITIIQPGVLP